MARAAVDALIRELPPTLTGNGKINSWRIRFHSVATFNRGAEILWGSCNRDQAMNLTTKLLDSV
jgi:hypothetical protein